MQLSRIVAKLFVAGVCCSIAFAAVAQDYPRKPIRLLAGAAGGSSDFAARVVAQGLTGTLGQTVLVDNRGFGVMAIEIAAKAPPDGYTMLFYGSALWTGPLMQKFSYDPVKDFAPVTLAMVLPNVLVVHPSVPATSIKELIALAKAKPGALNYGSGELGSSGHLTAEVFKSMTGINMVRIPYSGGGPATRAVLGGEVQVLFASTVDGSTHIKSGRLRGLGVSGAKRSPMVPDLPTIAEAGVPGYESVQRTGMFAPAKTPATLINRLQQETARLLARSDVSERFASSGAEVVGSTPQEFARQIKSEMDRLGPMIKTMGIK